MKGIREQCTNWTRIGAFVDQASLGANPRMEADQGDGVHPSCSHMCHLRRDRQGFLWSKSTLLTDRGLAHPSMLAQPLSPGIDSLLKNPTGKAPKIGS
jgi:hypothetical protein